MGGEARRSSDQRHRNRARQGIRRRAPARLRREGRKASLRRLGLVLRQVRGSQAGVPLSGQDLRWKAEPVPQVHSPALTGGGTRHSGTAGCASALRTKRKLPPAYVREPRAAGWVKAMRNPPAPFLFCGCAIEVFNSTAAKSKRCRRV